MLYRNFTQTMTFRSKEHEQVLALITEWDIQQANAEIMGYMRARLLVDRADPESYVLIADFGIVDPDVSPAEEAARNNERPETQAGAARLRAMAMGEIEYREYDEVYRTEQ